MNSLDGDFQFKSHIPVDQNKSLFQAKAKGRVSFEGLDSPAYRVAGRVLNDLDSLSWMEKKTYVVLPLSYQKIDCQSLALNINSFVQHMYGNDKQSGKEFKKNAHHIQKIQEKRDKALQSLNKAKLKYKSGDPKLAVAQKKI